jgi:hypothetical protein
MTYLHKTVAIQLAIVCGTAIVMQNTKLALSFILGAVFSYITMSNMITAQTRILITKNKNKTFMGLLNRLAFYGIPVIVAIKFPDKFTLLGVIPALWIYQINYIGSELVRSLKKVKKAKN